MARDQLLIGGHDGLAGFERAPNDLLRRIEPTDELNHDRDIGVQHRIHILGPDDIGRNPILLLACDVAIANVSELQRLVAALAQNFGDGPANRPEADQRNLAGRTLVGSVFRSDFRHRLGSTLGQTIRLTGNGIPYDTWQRCFRKIWAVRWTCLKNSSMLHWAACRADCASKLIIWCLPAAQHQREHRGHALLQAPLESERGGLQTRQREEKE